MSGSKRLRIGVDVGGTNTDGVIIDPSLIHNPSKGILAHHKAPTTTNPSAGINAAIQHMFTNTTGTTTTTINPRDVASVTIGTTHFVNAVVERDAARLCKVAVLRLAGPFGKHAPPCVDWPPDMRALVLGHWASVRGGLEVDGALIAALDEAAVRAQCREIKQRGIRSVVVNGVFSPIDTVHLQEERAAAIVREELGGDGGVDVVLSKEVANLGFLERENAAILNAAILPFARRTIRSFQDPIKKLGLDCPVFITQNDGTILSGEAASRLPIRTFSSGPTNSMRGAAFLTQGEETEGKALMVVDVGGTTTDVGLLQANGFPRQQAAYSDLAGIRMNFSCPDVKSIGLGGGSIVRMGVDGGRTTTVGPDSVGYKITEKAIVFGGDVLTATDATVASHSDVDIGDAALIKGNLSDDELANVQAVIKQKLEKVIDMMKTSPEDLPVLLVGGGAVIAPDELKGASKVLKPRWSGVANAIGAAMAGVSAVIDTVKSTESKSTSKLLEEISAEAVEKTVAAGASRESVKIVEMETLPLQYIANKSRFIVRAAGDFDFSRTADVATVPSANGEDDTGSDDMEQYEKVSTTTTTTNTAEPQNQPDNTIQIDLDTYRPTVRNRVWYLSETDLTFITTGCYILGTGGGGSPYSSMVRLRSILRSGATVRIISPTDLRDSDRVGCGGGMGSPTVGIEKLLGDEMMAAQEALAGVLPAEEDGGGRATHMIALEIGGGNGLQSMILGASSNMDVPVVDGDWMGRAYPTKWQTTPVVFDERSPVFCPIAMCDGNGNVLIMTAATSDLQVERLLRAAISTIGSHAGCAEGPVSGAETKRWVVEHTISESWRIGRAVERARRENRVDQVAEEIVKEVGGEQAAKVLWKGKIVRVSRTLRMGHIYGECVIEGMDVAKANDDGGTALQNGDTQGQFTGFIKIPFKNENIVAIRTPYATPPEGEEEAPERQEDVLCIVPDLIAVIDAQNGEAIGTPEYRYGLLVIVLGISASDRWTGTKRGIEIGGPEGFGIHHLKYEPLGTFVKPKSVIDEFDEKA